MIIRNYNSGEQFFVSIAIARRRKMEDRIPKIRIELDFHWVALATCAIKIKLYEGE